MFEGIRHNVCADGITSASYGDGEVIGFISFHVHDERACVMSSVGPDSAVRECSASHYYSRHLGRIKARTAEVVTDYS